jgi:putative endonuclease
MSASASSKAQRPWLLYLLECRGNKLYAGISPDPAGRFKLHCQGKGAKFTRANPPLRILAAQTYPSRSAALVAERELKNLRRPAKLLWAQQRLWSD